MNKDSLFGSTLIKKPVQLHITHSWGGGLERWVADYTQNDDKNRNLILRSLGTPGVPGQKVALYRSVSSQHPLISHQFTLPIYTTSTTCPEYRAFLQEIVSLFNIERVIISSFIGHSLDVLNIGLKTIVVCHDYYPFCPAINIYFNDVCIECTSTKLNDCYESNPFNRFFPHQSPMIWVKLREVYLKLIQSNNIPLVAPSTSVQQNLIKLDAGFQSVEWRIISHGLNINKSCLTIEEDKSNSKLKILVLGSLALHKGLSLFRESYKEITKIADVYLLGCGEEGLEFSGCPEIRIFKLRYNRDDLPSLMKQISPDLGLLLSVLPETFSYTLSELMLHNIPPLVTKIGSFEDRIREEENGFLVLADKKSLVKKLTFLSENRHLIHQVKKKLMTDNHKDVHQMIDEYEQVFLETPHNLSEMACQSNLLVMWEIEYQKIQGELIRSQSQLQQTQEELGRSQSQLQQTHEELGRSQSRITAMESSKFWKLRNLWFYIKQKLSFHSSIT